MSETSKPIDDVEHVVCRMPFFAVTATFFFSGGVFLVFTYPVLLQLALASPVKGIAELFTVVIVGHWAKALTGADGGVVATVALSLSLVLGLILVPVNRIVSATTAVLAQPLVNAVQRSLGWPHRSLFSAARFAEPNAPELLSWLMHRPSSKSHWEWEYFLYLLYWDLFTNALIFSLCSLYLLHSTGVWPALLLFGVIVLLLLLYALVRSTAMTAVHDFYASKVAITPNHDRSAARTDKSQVSRPK